VSAGAARLVLATRNAHKVGELRRILGPALDGIDLIDLHEAGDDGPEPVEDGGTFGANALIKARAASVATGLPAIADDSGICVDALGGAPGIRSARYAGTRDDGDNRDLLLRELADADDRSARFACAAALVLPRVGRRRGSEHVEHGSWPGEILREAAGSGGFGYDPVFRPAGSGRSAAELTPDEKNAVSHRGVAFGRLAPTIRNLLLGPEPHGPRATGPGSALG